MDDVLGPGRGAGRAGAHHLQGQGPGAPTTTRWAAACSGGAARRWRRWLMNESDLLVVFGASFSNHTGIASYKPIVQVDFDPMALGRFHPVTVPGAGPRRASPPRPAGGPVAPSHDRVDQRADVAARWAIWRAEKQRRLDDDQGRGVGCRRRVRLAEPSGSLPMPWSPSTSATTPTRSAATSSATASRCSCRGTSARSASAFLRRWARGPRRPGPARSWRSPGDGGFGQYLAELTTAVKYEMPITHVLLNNSELGKITKEQRAADMDVWQTSLHNPDFAAYAELCGALGVRVDGAGQLDAALAAGAGPRRTRAGRGDRRPRPGLIRRRAGAGPDRCIPGQRVGTCPPSDGQITSRRGLAPRSRPYHRRLPPPPAPSIRGHPEVPAVP